MSFIIGGNNRARTCDPLLVRQVLSQLSYAPSHAAQDFSRRLSHYTTSRRLCQEVLENFFLFSTDRFGTEWTSPVVRDAQRAVL